MINWLKIWNIAKQIVSEETVDKVADIASKAGMILEGGEEVFFLAVQLLDQVKAIERARNNDFRSRAFSPELDQLVARGVQAYVDELEDN